MHILTIHPVGERRTGVPMPPPYQIRYNPGSLGASGAGFFTSFLPLVLEAAAGMEEFVSAVVWGRSLSAGKKTAGSAAKADIQTRGVRDQITVIARIEKDE